MWRSKAGGLWRKTQRERRREGEERERGRWENSDGKKEWDGWGRFQQAAWNQVIIEIKRCHQFIWRSDIHNLLSTKPQQDQEGVIFQSPSQKQAKINTSVANF